MGGVNEGVEEVDMWVCDVEDVCIPTALSCRSKHLEASKIIVRSKNPPSALILVCGKEALTWV